ncbi:hypothetical protein TorRG33x02_249950, partial [Trema orientale]
SNERLEYQIYVVHSLVGISLTVRAFKPHQPYFLKKKKKKIETILKFPDSIVRVL